MKFILKIVVLIIILIISKLAKAQYSIVLNENAMMVMNNQVAIVINNPESEAISEYNGGGMIISEDIYNQIHWYIANQTEGIYTIPFGTNPIIQGGNEQKIPVTIEVLNGGSETVHGHLVFSTYETTNDDNTPWPQGVTNASDGLKAVDRFWAIYPKNYSTNPEVKLTIAYNDDVSELGGNNTLSKTNLTAQYYNDVTDLWQETIGTVNTTNNQVENIILNPSQFHQNHWLWTLVDKDDPLPIQDFEILSTCKNNQILLEYNFTDNINLIVLENSIDALNWNEIETIKSNKGKWYSKGKELGSFYRFKIGSLSGRISYSDIIKKECSKINFEATISPNPTNGLLHINVNKNEKVTLSIYDSNGKLIFNQLIVGNQSQHLDLSHLHNGLYIMNFLTEDGEKFNHKVIIK